MVAAAGLFGGASNHDLNGHALALWPKGGAVVLLEDERAARVDGVGVEDAFVGLAGDSAGLATFAVDEADDGSARPGRAGRARRPGCAGRPRVAFFALGGDLLFARREREGRQQHGNDEPARSHGASLDIPQISHQEIRTAFGSLKRPARWRRARSVAPSARGLLRPGRPIWMAPLPRQRWSNAPPASAPPPASSAREQRGPWDGASRRAGAASLLRCR